MKLYIARHGYAGDSSTDPKQERERQLTAEGKATVLAVANAMSDVGEVPNIIFCSPLARANMTADIFGRVLGSSVNVIGDLAPMRNIDAAILNLMSYAKAKRVMIVGHVDNTTPAMTGFDGDSKWKDLVMAEVRRVQIDRDSGDWKFRWGIKPSDVGRKDRAK